MMLPVVLLGLAFIPMILEARLSARNARLLRLRGAREPADDVYPIMQVAYPLCFVAMVAVAWLRGADPNGITWLGSIVFVAAKGLKYWAIATLGERWTFRVLVPPASSLTAAGPYRFLRHPNYIGVMGEIVGMALMSHAFVIGVVSTLGFGALLLARIRSEERALGLRSKVH
jgi:methyltransferase